MFFLQLFWSVHPFFQVSIPWFDPLLFPIKLSRVDAKSVSLYHRYIFTSVLLERKVKTFIDTQRKLKIGTQGWTAGEKLDHEHTANGSTIYAIFAWRECASVRWKLFWHRRQQKPKMTRKVLRRPVRFSTLLLLFLWEKQYGLWKNIWMFRVISKEHRQRFRHVQIIKKDV